jgi:hypothetical protein
MRDGWSGIFQRKSALDGFNTWRRSVMSELSELFDERNVSASAQAAKYEYT